MTGSIFSHKVKDITDIGDLIYDRYGMCYQSSNYVTAVSKTLETMAQAHGTDQDIFSVPKYLNI